MVPDRIDAAYFSPDIREFIRLLHRHAVRYVVVGAEAVIHYGHARLTGDIDFDNKQAAGRPKDIEDLAFLRKLRS